MGAIAKMTAEKNATTANNHKKSPIEIGDFLLVSYSWRL